MREKRQISHTQFQIFYGGTAASGEGHGNPSSILAWEIPWTEEPGGLQSMRSHRVGYD